MANLYLWSANPDFSFVLGKNPATGLQARSLRRGNLYGWYSEGNQRYNVYFRDGANDVSFRTRDESEFEYLNQSRYNSSYFVVLAINELFRMALKERVAQDVDAEHTLVIGAVNYAENVIRRFTKSLPQYVVVTEAEKKCGFLSITYRGSIHELLCYTSLLCLLLSFSNQEEYIQRDETFMVKYLECLNEVDPPYLLRSHFANVVVTSPNVFSDYRERLAGGHDMVLKYGNNQSLRREYVRSVVPDDGTPILDLGCGTGHYAKVFYRQVEAGRSYTAVDIDEGVMKKVEVRYPLVTRLVGDAVDVVSRGDAGEATVLLVEVVEHMKRERADMLLRYLQGARRVVITTPNRDFNQFYYLDGEFRHEDHQWEMGESEFQEWVRSSFPSGRVTFSCIGDEVEGVPCTLGAVIELGE